MLGEAIGRFRVQGRVGHGGFGEVFLAVHQDAQHQVAIKLFRPEVTALPAMAQLLDEARKASRLSDAGIAKVYDAGTHRDGRAYLITAWVGPPAVSLAQRIAHSRMSSTQVADMIVQLARALATAHAAGVGHGNLKPTNVFVVPDPDRPGRERAIVVDFCHGALVAASPGLGSVAYLAPELLTGRAADQRADIYAIGCLAFEMVCQRPPFTAKTHAELRDKHLNDPPPLARAFAPDTGAVVEKLIAKMLAKRPEDRPRHLREVSKLFEMIVGFDAPLGDTVKS
jgi:serine/threonine-protein kinase